MYYVCVFLQNKGSGLSAMHVACIKGRADIVELLITRAEENLLNKSLKEILNAKTKVSVYFAVKSVTISITTYPFISVGELDTANVCCEKWPY